MMDEISENEAYWLFFCEIEGLGNIRMDRMLDRFGSAKAIFKATDKELHNVAEECDIRGKVVAEITEKRRKYNPADEYMELDRLGLKFMSRENSAFPTRLLEISDPPNGLFYRGNLPDGKRPAVAIVGSRNCSIYGREMSLKLGRELAASGIDIISGMAAGIDGYAHRGALNGGGRTYAVLGCGAEKCYPSSNIDIYRRIPEQGGVLSEYGPGTPAFAGNFPRRNRLISGLSDAVLVVEAREKSGTSITVDMALEQGRDIFAIPGRVTDELSSGCNRLIRQGARLVTDTEDVIAELASHYGYLVDRRGKGDTGADIMLKSLNLSISENTVYKLLDMTPRSVGELAERADMEVAEVMSVLGLLELKELASPACSGMYIRRGI